MNTNTLKISLIACLVTLSFSVEIDAGPVDLTLEEPLSIVSGTVMEVFPYRLDGVSSGKGAAIGGVVGFVGAMRSVDPCELFDNLGIEVIGGLAGSIVGEMIEKRTKSELREVLYIILDDGTEIAVDQPASSPSLKANSKVKVLSYRKNVKRVYGIEVEVEWEVNPYRIKENEK